MPSVAEFGTLSLLAYLLHLTSGVTGEFRTENGPVSYRANYSGGALYPIEVFVLVRGFDIPEGLYYFDPGKSRVLRMASENIWAGFSEVVADKVTVEKARLVFFYTGVLDRCVWRYKETAYRRVLLDAGAAFGNTVMQAQAMGLGTVPLSGFIDNRVESLLELRSGEIPLAILAVDPLIENRNELFSVPSMEPALAAKSLSFESTELHLQAQLLCQNQAERIPGPDFRAPQAYFTEKVTGERQKLFSSYLTPEDIRCQLPVYSWHRRVCQTFSLETLPFDSLSVTLALAYHSLESISVSAGFLKHWLLVFDVNSIEKGLYRYLPSEHALVYIHSGISRDVFGEVHVNATAFQKCAAVLLQTADLDASTAVMGDRIYRYLHLDAGLICESINVWGALTQVSSSSDSFYYEDEYKRALNFALRESIISETALGIGRS
jgi:SagB-type dehydrogenase family enzyme